MLKFLSRVRIEFNALDPRTASCMEFLKQCNTRKAKDSNPACQLQVKRRTDDHPPQITVTFLNGVEEVFDAANTPAQTITDMILDKGQFLQTEQMFRQAGQPWPVIIPHQEILQPHQPPATKVRIVFWVVVEAFRRTVGMDEYYFSFFSQHIRKLARTAAVAAAAAPPPCKSGLANLDKAVASDKRWSSEQVREPVS
ncbi:Ribosomal protein [Fagus crenata]